MVDVDAIDRHAERSEGVSLGGEILLVGQNAGVSISMPGILGTVAFESPSSRSASCGSYGTPACEGATQRSTGSGVPRRVRARLVSRQRARRDPRGRRPRSRTRRDFTTCSATSGNNAGTSTTARSTAPTACCAAAGGATTGGAAAPRCGAAATRPSRSTTWGFASLDPCTPDRRRVLRPPANG
jgi:hypothetical protein